MMEALFYFAVDVANIVLAALLAAQIIVAAPRQRTAQLCALLLIAAICHVVLGRYEYAYWIPSGFRIDVRPLVPALNLIRNLAPGLLMIIVHDLFTDQPAMPRFVMILFALQIFLEEPVRWLLPTGGQTFWVWTQLAPTLLQTCFAALAVYWTLHDWRGDLIEARRNARVVMAVLLSVNVVASSLLLRVVIPGYSPVSYAVHEALSVANLVLLFALLIWLKPESMLGLAQATGRPAAVPPASTRSDDTGPILARLELLMEKQRIYRQAGLTLAALARAAAVPEYRLRRLIHEELGYRNFNAYLHRYRIAEACSQLRDPRQRRTPVLTIALSVGYQSVNTFNRGFREIMAITPTEFRAGPAAGTEYPAPKSE